MLSVVISKKYGQKVTCQNSTKHSFTITIDLSSSSVRSLCYECPLTKDAQPVNLSAQTLPTSSLTFSLAHLGFYCPSLQSLLVSSVPWEKPYRQLHKIVAGLWEEQRCAPTILFCQEPRIWAGPKMVAWDRWTGHDLLCLVFTDYGFCSIIYPLATLPQTFPIKEEIYICSNSR